MANNIINVICHFFILKIIKIYYNTREIYGNIKSRRRIKLCFMMI